MPFQGHSFSTLLSKLITVFHKLNTINGSLWPKRWLPNYKVYKACQNMAPICSCSSQSLSIFYHFQAWTNYLTVTLIEDFAILGTCYFSVWGVIHTFPCIKTCRVSKNLELSTLKNFHYACFYFHIQTFFWKLVFPINFDLKAETCSSSQFQSLMLCISQRVSDCGMGE